MAKAIIAGRVLKRKRIRVLHCPTFGAGQPGKLAVRERSFGLKSCSVSIEAAAYGFAIDHAWNPFRHRWVAPAFKELLRWPLLIRALCCADIIHYNFGQTIMPQWYGTMDPKRFKGLKRLAAHILKFYVLVLEHSDLVLLKALGKKIVVTYQGDDARQGDYCKSHYQVTAANHVGGDYYSHESDAHKRRLIEKVSRYADRIYALNPDLLHILPDGSQFLPYANVDINEIRPVRCNENEKRLVIHAPTHRGVKGTEFILAAVEKLQHEGFDFDFQLIEGLSHSEALTLYVRADLLIDQLLIGWYGGLAVELMAMGKPVICYIREDDLCYLPDQMRRDLPIINACPDNIYAVLKKQLLAEEIQMQEIGKRSRSYVEAWHDPLKVARQLKTDYEYLFSQG